MNAPTDPAKPDSSKNREWMVPVLLGLLMGGLLLTWQILRWQKAESARESPANVPGFAQLSPEQQAKILKVPGMWYLAFDRDVAAGKLKLSRPTTVMVMAGGYALEGEKVDIPALTDWFQKNVPAEKGAIRLTIFVPVPNRTRPNVVRSRVFKIDRRSVKAEFEPEDNSLGGRFLQAQNTESSS